MTQPTTIEANEKNYKGDYRVCEIFLAILHKYNHYILSKCKTLFTITYSMF